VQEVLRDSTKKNSGKFTKKKGDQKAGQKAGAGLLTTNRLGSPQRKIQKEDIEGGETLRSRGPVQTQGRKLGLWEATGKNRT